MRKTIIFFIFFTSFLALAVSQETEVNDFKKVFGLPPFIFRTFQFPASDSGKTRLEVNLGLVNDILQFVKREDGAYAAGYEIALDLLDSSGTIITGTVTQHDIRVNEFEESNSRQYYHTHRFHFEAPAGKYALHLDIIDLETRKRLTRREDIKVRGFPSNQLQISSIVFLSGNSDTDSLSINLTEIYAKARENIFIQFTFSGIETGRLLDIDYVLKDWDDRIISSWKENLKPVQSNLQLVRSMTEYIANAGNYTLSVQCSQNNISVEEHGTFSVKFQPGISNGKASHSLSNNMILALKYICKSDFYKQVIAADSIAQKELIHRYWQEHDPTPGTSENELRNEFQRRVTFANTHFSVLAQKIQGWEADRGKVYILNGPPTWVRTQSNEFGRPPIEIWYYKDLDIRFVFRDKKGDGHYKLIHEE